MNLIFQICTRQNETYFTFRTPGPRHPPPHREHAGHQSVDSQLDSFLATESKEAEIGRKPKTETSQKSVLCLQYCIFSASPPLLAKTVFMRLMAECLLHVLRCLSPSLLEKEFDG